MCLQITAEELTGNDDYIELSFSARKLDDKVRRDFLSAEQRSTPEKWQNVHPSTGINAPLGSRIKQVSEFASDRLQMFAGVLPEQVEHQQTFWEKTGSRSTDGEFRWVPDGKKNLSGTEEAAAGGFAFWVSRTGPAEPSWSDHLTCVC